MSYLPTNIPNLDPGEVGVQLDTGQYVALLITPSVLDSGALALCCSARVVDTSGNPVLYGNQPLVSSYSHSCGPADVSLYGNADGVAKQVALAVLGEPSLIFSDPTNSGVHVQAASDASIRTNIASHQVAQTLTLQAII